MSNQNKGIDAKEALSILSARQANNNNKQNHIHILPSQRSAGGGTSNNNDCNDSSMASELRGMGQTVDLMASQERTSNNGVCDGCTGIPNNEDSSSNPTAPPTMTNKSGTDSTDAKKDSLQNEKLREELSKQSPYELLQTLFKLQQERVTTYQRFNAGLTTVLQTGNLTQYPHLTTSITATFAVLSNSIKEIQQIFTNASGKEKKDVAKWITKLQSLEREKLNYTAALHLEKIRERNEMLNLEDGEKDEGEGGSNDADASGSERIMKLLKESVVNMESKVNDCIEQINEILEELRYASVDMEE